MVVRAIFEGAIIALLWRILKLVFPDYNSFVLLIVAVFFGDIVYRVLRAFNKLP